MKTKNISKEHILGVGQTRWFWLSVLALCVALDGAALYYQHVLELLPCELCIYVRVWVFAIALVSIVAIFVRGVVWLWVLVSLGALALALGLANETWNLIVVEYGLSETGGSCSFFANFPSWAPLDKWLPSVFEVQELCQATPEIIFGITMADSLVLVSLGLIVAFSISLFGALISLRK